MTVVEAIHQLLAGPCLGGADLLDPGGGEGGRFFAEDMLARLQRGDGHVLVQRIDAADEDAVDLGIVQDGFMGRDGQVGGQFVAGKAVDRRDLARFGAPERVMARLSHLAIADDSEFQHQQVSTGKGLIKQGLYGP